MSDMNIQVVDALKKVLGDAYALYLKTHGYHWNVEGPNFKSLHDLFEENYRALFASMDDIAERIRALGAYAPAGGKELAELSSIESGDNDIPSANGMIQNLVAGHESFLVTARQAMRLAGDHDDVATEDLLSPLIAEHEKMAWMLRSSLER
ncbi:MAG: DNA starvation/stationary phase protection protein [Pseudomonadota bacterium]